MVSFKEQLKAHYNKNIVILLISVRGAFPQTLISVVLNHANSLNWQAMNS